MLKWTESKFWSVWGPLHAFRSALFLPSNREKRGLSKLCSKEYFIVVREGVRGRRLLREVTEEVFLKKATESIRGKKTFKSLNKKDT